MRRIEWIAAALAVQLSGAPPPSAALPVSAGGGAGAPLSDAMLAPESLEIDGAPAIPAALVSDIARYTRGRSALMRAWHPTKREILISTRFRETLQLHRVRMPGGARTQLTFLDDEVQRGVSWDPSGASILFTADRSGDGNDQIYRLDAATGAIALVTDGRSRNGVGLWANGGGRIVYTSTRRNGRDADLYLIDPNDPSTNRLLAEVEGADWRPLAWSPGDKRILVQQTRSATDSALWLVDATSGAMTSVASGAAYRFGAFDHDGLRVLTTSDVHSEFRELVSIDLQSHAIKRLTQSIPWDVIELDVSSDGRRAAIVTNEAGIFTLHILDVATGKEQRVPRLPGWVTDVQWRPNNRELAFGIDSSRAPLDVYSLDVPTGKLERWTESETGGVDLSQFPEPQLVSWKSFDGRAISGFLYMPPPRFEGKRPVLISIHGGPEEQFTPYFLGRWNYVLNEMGIVLLYPNVRGSSGFGKSFLKLDDGLRREDALKDVGALLDWIAAQPRLDASRVAVTGFSYGGFLALSTAARYNDRIRATIDIVGPSNLVTFLENTAEWRRELRRVEYGDERDSATRAFLERIAPQRNAASIRRPLMVVQGQQDPAVRVSEAMGIVSAVRENGTTVWYVLGKDEGHGFRRKTNGDYLFYLTVSFLRTLLL